MTDADFIAFDEQKAKIGRLLFYDPILSGNRNISCGTCHHHDHAGADGLSLGVGEGGVGVGPDRLTGTGESRILKRIPRNAPALWNLGHADIDLLFHDGRLSVSNIYDNGFDSPAEERLPPGLDGILAAQALFPLTSEAEMAGNSGENEVAGEIKDRIDEAWPILARRIQGIPEYAEMFIAAFPEVEHPKDITIVHIGNAIGAFVGTEWRNHDSQFDRYLTGDASALSPGALRGMELFFGKVGCSNCHSGPLLSDFEFHALGLPQFGPGRTRRWDPIPRDVGRMADSNALEDAYKFRTPMLRNVALTAPYGHNGAMPTLEAMVRHHLAPLESRRNWDPEMAALPPAAWLTEVDHILSEDKLEMARQEAAIEILLPPLDDRAIEDLVEFLNALTGETAEARPMGRPDRVPSGLPVD